MDEQRFDQLSRRLAGFRTRRQAVKAIAGAVVATIAGTRAADAQSCTPPYSPCGDDGACCAGAVCEYGLCMPGCRIDGAFVTAWMSPTGNICGQCLPDVSTTSWSPANEGMSCWSGDPTAGVTTCQQGVCRSTGPVDCRPLTACHTAAINPQTGQCVQSVAEAGTPCGNPAMCHGDFYQPADSCDGAGFCIGGGSQTRSCAPYVCGQGSCTTSCVTDTDCAPHAHCDDGQCFPDADLGQPCDEDSDCQSGVCAEGVCCDRRCAGLCETCSPETGGICSPVPCDDGLSCTSGICDEGTGQCSHVLNPGACLIDGACYAVGDRNPNNGCQVCDPDAPGVWTDCATDEVCWKQTCVSTCTDSADCAGGAVCYQGACVTSIDGVLETDGPHGTGCNPYLAPYDAYTIEHGGGPLAFGLIMSAPLTSGFMILLETAYDPEQGCINRIADTRTNAGTAGQCIAMNDLAAGTYAVVVQSFASDPSLDYGPYTLVFGSESGCP